MKTKGLLGNIIPGMHENFQETDTMEQLWHFVMDIMWPISQSHFHISGLCSLK